ncbi:serine-threonine protein kinase [Streptomyces sp. NA02950]|uniref:serine-threonine protein kinase n=1 Tax=Streptomyces sp. NA02950 TaxID=2742137 RepID=UPI0015921633|nr:serine-threonine protein kinase [Streptomyces sp. NA02950]QKV95816.1 serine-threonine protein kinase [Streptomyces sp. NA02950]
MTGMKVRPYWELRFDADGDVDTRQRDRLTEQVEQQGITDLVVFAHGWNNDRAMATALYERFFAPFPGLLGKAAGVRLGYAGVMWPSMRFTDEAVPAFPPTAAAGAEPGLDEGTRGALETVFPGRGQMVARLAQLLAERPERASALDEFTVLVRGLARVPEGSGAALYAPDVDGDELPAMLGEEGTAYCELFATALAEAEERGPGLFGGGFGGLWDGARELLRQTTYYAMKRRAGTVGRDGLGPALGAVAAGRPGVRIHLVGHSFGGRLVSYALGGLPGDTTVASLTLLQGAFSHYAFAERLPHAADRGGALRADRGRVRGPLVSCHSRHDTALGVLYPLASRAARDDSSLLGRGDARWGAMGHGGIQAVAGCARLDLAEALEGPFPQDGCVSVDVSSVVRHGGPPAGAHSDICHEELARVVLAAGRIAGR